MHINKLLYATDGSKGKFGALEDLMVLRRLGLEEVLILHPGTVEDLGERVEDYGFKSKILAPENLTFSGILDTVRREEVSVLAVNLKRGSRKIFRGSLIKDLLRASPIPVMVHNGDSQIIKSKEGGPFHHVVFATDWSPLSERVLRYILNLKELINMLEIVNVINKKFTIRDMRNLRQKLVETRKIFLDEGIDAEAHVYAGKPAEEILLAAREYGATSIIMGSSRKSMFENFFLRSCSYRVAEETVVPALFIPEPAVGSV